MEQSEASAPGVSVATDGEVAVVTLDRPPVNALDAELLEALTATAARLAAERPAAVVLTGAGRCFSAGMDLRTTPQLDAGGQRRTVAALNDAFAAWYRLPLPVVAAVGGPAIAGGMILALCADVRVAAAGAPWGLAEVRVGIPYPRAALAVVRAELTGPAARRLALGAANVAAEELIDAGAVDEVIAAEELIDAGAVDEVIAAAELIDAGAVDEVVAAEAPAAGGAAGASATTVKPAGDGPAFAVAADAVRARALAVARELGALDARAYADTKLRLRAPALAEMDGPDPLVDGWLGPVA
jgi:enoyl-CoA hydratase